MFLSYLLSFPARGQQALYLWVLYKQIAHFTPQEVAFIGSAAYFRPPEEYERLGRRDISPEAQETNAFDIPSCDQLERYTRYLVPDDVFAQWQTGEPNADRVMCRILTERCKPLEGVLRRVLGEATMNHDIEAVLTWCNTPSLSVVAAEFGLTVVHHELGPLRGPCYHWTAYFDRSGVNGNTESAYRYRRFLLEIGSDDVPVLATHQLRDLFVINRSPPEPPDKAEFAIGVPLQVENDTNIIAYANGWSNERLIEAIGAIYGRDRILIRKHPGGLCDYSNVGAQVDHSAHSVAFIRRCARMATINSSIGLESLLFDRETTILGDSPFRFAAQQHLTPVAEGEASINSLQALNFLLFGYLIPYELLFDPAYLRWRLCAPGELAIYRFHLDYVRKRRRFLDEGARFRQVDLGLAERGLLTFWQTNMQRMTHRLAALELQLEQSVEGHAHLGRTLDKTLASWSWRLTAPLRWVHQKAGQRRSGATDRPPSVAVLAKADE